MLAQDKKEAIVSYWRRTARGRLRFELSGVAYALSLGKRPEDWARHLWGQGAVAWMGKERPTAGEYLLKEAEAFQALYPAVRFAVLESGERRAEMVFTAEGCLGGWGKERWAVAHSLGLVQEQVCAYCQEAFRLWAGQLGLVAHIGPYFDGTCHFMVEADNSLK